MTLFPQLKEDFTAENGVTYTWEENRWRTKSFLTADGSEVEVGPVPPADPSEGGLWYDSTRLELFVFYTDPDGVGGWVPCSPLGARVEAGEIVQAQLVERVGELEKRDPGDYLEKAGGTMSGTITSDQASGSALIVKKNGRNTVRIDQGGKIYSSYDPEIDEDPTTVLTRGFAEDHYVRTTKNSTMTDSYLRINKKDPNTHLILDFKRSDDEENANKSNRFIDIKEDDHRLLDLQSTAAGFTQIEIANDRQEFKIVGKVDGAAAQMFKVYSSGKIGLFNVKTPANSGDCANKGYVDDKVAAASGGPLTKHDGNRMCVIGLSTTTLSNNDVLFMTDQLVSTLKPSEVRAVGLPLDEFDWDNCAKSGVIKVKVGTTVAGYYQVYDAKEVSGRNMTVYVKPIEFDDSAALEEGGCPCYFQGVFF